jgi:hypothetical protein
MKANEAPEKIYMTPSFGEPDNVLLASFSKSHLDFHRDIEYIRIDAFIEKACEFIDERLIFDDNAWYVEGEITIKDKVIEDFKNYMKGE